MINEELYRAAEKTVSKLKENDLKLATAESCTGGMAAAFITSVSGVSDVFELGVTSYSCRIKNEVLGVKNETLERYGAVSEQTAREMAVNVRKKANADIGASVTGAAGPDGTEGHPPGYVFIAVAGKEKVWVELLNIEPKSRNYVREKTVEALFNLINNYIEDCKK